MRISDEVRVQLARRFDVLFPHLNERQRRLALATEARLLGHGGVGVVARIAEVSETTVRKGVWELEAGADPLPEGRVRRPGGGRMRAEAVGPRLVPALMALVEPDERGDPMSPLRWTTKSLRHLATELSRQGHRVTAPTVGRLLKEQGFSLQGTAKTLEGDQHPDRDAQFHYINEQVKEHQAAGEPVISVDAKKKEQIGQLPMPGREWRPAGQPVEVEGPQLLRRPARGVRDPVRDLRHGREHRLGERRHRPQHRHIRRLVDPTLVAGARPVRLPRGIPAADHRGRRGLQQLPLPGMEGRTGRVRRRCRPDSDGLSLSSGYVWVRRNGTKSSTGCSPTSP